MELLCPKCDHEITVEYPFQQLNTDIICPNCQAHLEIEIDEGEDDISAWLVLAPEDKLQ